MNKVATHVLHVGGRTVQFRIRVTSDRIHGALDVPKRLRSAKHQRAVQIWFDDLCEMYADDEREFHLVVTQGRTVRMMGCEKGGAVTLVFA